MGNRNFWYVLYTDGCSPSYRRFKERAALEAWAGRFTLRNLDNPDSWIDAVFYGELHCIGNMPVYNGDAETALAAADLEDELAPPESSNPPESQL